MYVCVGNNTLRPNKRVRSQTEEFKKWALNHLLSLVHLVVFPDLAVLSNISVAYSADWLKLAAGWLVGTSVDNSTVLAPVFVAVVIPRSWLSFASWRAKEHSKRSRIVLVNRSSMCSSEVSDTVWHAFKKKNKQTKIM